MADMEVILGTVLYYAREGCYRHMQMAMTDLLKRFGSDPILLFWRAFSMILEDRIVEGMRELKGIQDSPDVMLAAPLLLIYAHNQCQSIDKEAIQELEGIVKRNLRSSTDKEFYYAAVVYWLTGRNDKAKELLDKCLKASPSAKAYALMGWIYVTSGKEEFLKKSLKYFNEAYKGTSEPPIIAVLGKARHYTLSYQYIQAVDVLNSSLIAMPSLLPLYLEKMKLQLALHEWDVAVEIAERCLSLDQNCIEATEMIALKQCILNGDMNEVGTTLGKLLEQLDQSEPKSHKLYFTAGQTFSRLCGSHSYVLQQTQTLIDRALNLSPSSPTYVIERAYQYLLSGEYQQALSLYKKALAVNDVNLAALSGLVHSKLKLNRVKEGEQHVEFLNEMQGASKTGELFYLQALVIHMKGGVHNEQKETEIVNLISKATKVHFSNVKGYPLGMEYFFRLNPSFVISLGELLMAYAPSEPPSMVSGGSSSSLLQEINTTLGPLVHVAPGLLHVQLLLAHVHYLSGNSESALSMAQMCVNGNHRVVAALLLQAVIHLQKGNQQQCGQLLETALSTDFEVQHYPLYLLVKGQQQYISGQFTDSINSLQLAMRYKKNTANITEGRSSPPLLSPPTASQWVSGHLTLAQALSKAGLQNEAGRVMQDCITEFTGTSEEARVTIAHAELLLCRGNSKGALEMLSKITDDKPYFIQAKERMAEIYLNYERNKQQYIQCYRDIADKLPGPPTAHLLGDALLAIHEPEEALAVFEKALKKTPSDAVLASKVGHSYIKMHNFSKAVSYYEASLKSIDHPGLKCDLALLYIRLQRYDQAERVLLQALADVSKGEESQEKLQCTKDSVRYCQLLTKVYYKTNRYDGAIEALEKAKSFQSEVVKRVVLEEPDMLQAEKEVLASILHQLAKDLTGSNSTQADIYYNEAIQACPEIPMYRESLAQWYLSEGKLDQCEQECVTLLQADPTNDVATAILAELLFVKGDIAAAIKHFEDFLARKPTHFKGLARFIDLVRRGGNLQTAKPFLELAESETIHPDYNPGLKFCKGLYCWYKKESEEALGHFNHARHDPEWGEQALFNMINICLHSEDIIGAETLKGSDSDSSLSGSSSSSVKKLESEVMAAKTAEKLLKEICPKSPTSLLKVKVLENYVHLVGNQSKNNIEKVLAKLTNELEQHERESVPCLVVMATGFLLTKQGPRARNLLKRLGKTPWSAQYSEELEKGWLLLADVYIQSGKYDLAIEQLKKCLKYNKSCSKASEYLGYIAEKEQAYKDAAVHYSNAWISGHMTNPTVGYRLAFNYLKGQFYLLAIDACHEVLANHPNYPRIKGEILEKARLSIRI